MSEEKPPVGCFGIILGFIAILLVLSATNSVIRWMGLPTFATVCGLLFGACPTAFVIRKSGSRTDRTIAAWTVGSLALLGVVVISVAQAVCRR